jgi:hypothetical protein
MGPSRGVPGTIRQFSSRVPVVVVREGVQQHIRRTHGEISVNGYPLGGLACDSLKAIVAALSVNGAAQRGAASYQGPQEQ